MTLTPRDLFELATHHEEIASIYRRAAQATPETLTAPAPALSTALTTLAPRYRVVMQRLAASSDLAETIKGVACRWLPIEEATAGLADTPRGQKRVLTSISRADPALAGVGWATGEDEGEVLARIPENVAEAVRTLWGQVTDDKDAEA